MVTNTDEIMLRVEKLSELELSELIESIKEHCYKNKMNHLVEDDNDQQIESMELEIEDLNTKIHYLEKQLEERQSPKK